MAVAGARVPSRSHVKGKRTKERANVGRNVWLAGNTT